MSVYIKGMEMPTSCSVCPIMRPVKYYEEICPLLEQYACRYDRNEDCPLIPVPDHGRLIDADAMLVGLDKRWHPTAQAANKMPTIIPEDADKGDEDHA